MIRRHPGALPGDPHIELDGEEPFEPSPPRSLARPSRDDEPTVDYSFDQRHDVPRAPFRPGERVTHASLGEGIVVACDAGGSDAKATVRFYTAGEKRVVARFLRREG